MNEMLSTLKQDEKVQLRLRELYSRSGYTCFKMSKFEEYDLYVRNKDFLVSDGVITFTDTNGKLMALKPDVTLSIVKNTRDEAGSVQRLYYHENVYRVSEQTHAFKEIMQAGLECIGDLDEVHLCEVARLAAESLRVVSSDCVLNLSHLGILSAVLADPSLAPLKQQLLPCIGQKNSHGVAEICARAGVDPALIQTLQTVAFRHGAADEVLASLGGVFPADSPAGQALAELASVAKTVAQITECPIRLDLSLVGDMRYYNGLILQGFVNGVPSAVLSGGQYDPLMKRMGKSSRAVGFAVYLDPLERMQPETEFDADVILLYDDQPAAQVLAAAVQLTNEGKRVITARRVPNGIKARQIVTVADQTGGADHA